MIWFLPRTLCDVGTPFPSGVISCMCIHLLWIIRPCWKTMFTLIWEIVWYSLRCLQVNNLLKSFVFFPHKLIWFHQCFVLFYLMCMLFCICLPETRLDKKGYYRLEVLFTGHVSSILLYWCMLRFLLTVRNHSISFQKRSLQLFDCALCGMNVCTILSSWQVWI